MADLVSADVVVIGAGCAGLAAAVKLAAAGRRVVVAEEAPRLGGRVSAFTDRPSGERVDNGQHVLFGCYRATYEFLREIGTADLAPLQKTLSLSMAGRDGRASSLRCPNWPAPWHLVAGLLRWSAIPVGDRLSVLRLRGLLDRVRREGAAAVALSIDSTMTVSEWLAANGQSPRLCEWLWAPLVFAALNQSPGEAAASVFVRVLGALFGRESSDAALALPRVPLDELFATPAVAFIEARGGSVHPRSPACILPSREGIWHVRVGSAIVRAPAVISAVPWHAMDRLWESAPPPAMADTVARAIAMRSMPIVTANLWFDRPVMTDTPLVGFVGGTVQWFFDKAAVSGGAAQHISAVVSGAVDLVRQDNEVIAAIAERDARHALRGARDATLLRALIVREPRATFSLAPGGSARPATRTGLAGFYLAGDWTDTGLPGTIEGAVLSGHRAAAAVLS